MPALAEIGKFRRLAELFVLALKVDMVITAEQNMTAVASLMEYGLSERQAESFLNSGFDKLDRGLVRSPRQTLEAVAIAFRPRDHAYILGQVQAILEQKDITDKVQMFFDLCCTFLYHEEFY